VDKNDFFGALIYELSEKVKLAKDFWSVKPRLGGRTPTRLGGIYDFSLTSPKDNLLPGIPRFAEKVNEFL